jgi:hypothetical protein
MMKAAPGSAFEVVEAQLTLELLVIAFNTPPKFDQRDESFD